MGRMGDMPMPTAMAMPPFGSGGMPMPDAGADAGHGGKKKMMMMHMTFFWGDRVLVLFSGWPGDRGVGMYLLCLLLVLALAALVEALPAASRRLASRPGAAPSLLLSAIHAAKMGMAYLVMLAVMSFNVGVLIAAILGHAIGFLICRSGLFMPRPDNTHHASPSLPSCKP